MGARLLKLDGIREEELQGRLDSKYMRYVSEMVSYLINPQGKLPPLLRENNLGFIYAQNLLNLGASINFEKGTVDTDRETILDNLHYVQTLLQAEYDIDDNLTFYPLYLESPSNSSKFVHGLPYIEILEKWHGEFDKDPSKLKNFIEGLRDKIHIDSDLVIESTSVSNGSILIRFKKDAHDVTMAIGYSTKHQKYTVDTNTIELIDGFGNIFSPKGVESLEYYFSDDVIAKEIEKVHKMGGKFMMNFYAWRAPEYVTEDNYKYYHYDKVPNEMSDEEAIFRFKGVLHHFGGGRIVVHQVNEHQGNYLSATQDQILPDYGRHDGNDEEKEKYAYWKGVYTKELFRLVDLGVDAFRIDLAHGFTNKFGDFTLFQGLLHDTIAYANEKYKRKMYFVLETYDFTWCGGPKPANFRDWNHGLDYPAIKVYNKEIEDKISRVKGEKGLESLMLNLEWLLQNNLGVNGEMMAVSTFDDHTLRDISRYSGIKHEHVLEMQLLLGKAGFNVLSLDRDFEGLEGEVVSSVPGGNEEPRGTGIYVTHKVATEGELRRYIETGPKGVFEESVGMQVLRDQKSSPEIKGVTLEKESKVLKFIFEDNTERVFDFKVLVHGGSPYTTSSISEVKRVKGDTLTNLVRLEALEGILKGSEKKAAEDGEVKLAHTYEVDFWSSLANFVTTHAWIEAQIPEWDKQKQEAYFLLNKKRLIESYFAQQGAPFPESHKLDEGECAGINDEVCEEIQTLRVSLKAEADRILRATYQERYSDLV